jgi:hypothetical protein
MAMLSYSSWQDRESDENLRDAWFASRDFAMDRDWSSLRAHCGLCGQTTPFRLLSDPSAPDLREGLICQRCGCNSRIRGAVRILLDRLPPPVASRPRGLFSFTGRQSITGPNVYMTEQVTPTFVWMQKNLPGVLHGSEFEPGALRRRNLTRTLAQMGGRGRVRFQDVTRLDFSDASLDAVVSFDVLAHVPDYAAAIREFARVLKPGGLCVATYPFNDRPETLIRARLNAGGDIEHIEPPEYHGDPIGGGILCYYHFGWDSLDRFRDAGFSEACMVMPYSLEQGLPYGMWTLLARR